MSAKLVVVAIAVGNEESGYSFSSISDYKTNPLQIFHTPWQIPGFLSSPMAPTCVLFSKEKVFDSFGYKAVEKYSELSLEGEHEGWYFFKHFLLTLLKQKQPISKSAKLKSTDGKEMMALEVFSAIIKFLKDHFIHMFNRRGLAIDEKDMQWVLPVPAAWYNDVKHYMKNAAENAGISDDQLFVITEEEVGIVYCKHLPIERLYTEGRVHDTSAFTVGSKHIVLNCKDEAMFLAVYKINEDFSPNELYNACYETVGGNQLLAAFKRLLTKIVGAPTMTEFSLTYPADNMEIYNDFKIRIRKIKPETKGMITIIIPFSLLEIFEETIGEKINEVIKDSTISSKVKFVEHRMRISADLLKDLLIEQSAQMLAHVNDALQIPAIKGTKNIVMIGKFSDIPILQYKIREAFPEMRVIIPDDLALAHVKGAVLYGHVHLDKPFPKYVTCRVAKFIDFFQKRSDRVKK